MIYLVVFVEMLYFIIYYDIGEKTKNRDFWYKTIMLELILFAGLRWRLGVDTPNYIYYFYHEYPTLEDFSFEEYGILKSPFYVLMNSVVRSIGGRFYIVQLIQASIVNVLIFKYIKKHCRYIFTCVFFYFTCYCFTEYNMEIMRGSISVVICLYANDYILKKQWLKGYFLFFIALLFHAQTLVMFVLPIMFFLRLNRVGVLFIVGSFLVGMVLQNLLGNYLSMLEMVSESTSQRALHYVELDLFGDQNHNFKYMAVLYLPWKLYGISSLLYIKKFDRENPLLCLEPLIIIGCMFILIQMNMQIAYRFVDYYRIYFVILFSELFINLIKHKSVLSKRLSLVRALVVFVPLFFMIGFSNYLRKVEYFPYTSVIDRTINKERELNYHRRLNPRPDANLNEY